MPDHAARPPPDADPDGEVTWMHRSIQFQVDFYNDSMREQRRQRSVAAAVGCITSHGRGGGGGIILF